MSARKPIKDTLPRQVAFLDPRDWMKPYSIPNFLSPQECMQVREYWNEGSKAKVKMYTTGKDEFVSIENKNYREGNLCWIKPEKSPWLFDRLMKAIWKLNDLCFGVNITGMYDDMQLAKYTVGDFYGKHRDCGPGRLRFRKLSFSLQLSDPADYEGGELDIFGQPAQEKAQGTLIVFPSFMLHQVLPVTKGERFSLVSWIVGSEWR